MSGPRILDLPLWESHERRVLAVLRSALRRLPAKRLRGDESELNRELHLLLRDVNKENRSSGSDLWVDEMPILEARNPPTPGTENLASERKIPDLQWRFEDHLERDARRSERTFVIECKRLGARSGAGRGLNVRYADQGVRRFAHPEWRYGGGVASGAMVGYVESLTLEEIIADVNRGLIQLQLPALNLPQTAGRPLTEMAHTFNRPFEVSPFRLVHLWVDIRPRVWQVVFRCLNRSP